MTEDPLTSFVARSLRAEVSDVRSEVVAKNASLELERIRFRQEGEARSLVVKRVPPSDALEVQLLPLLARKTDRVALVRSRGIPPAAVPAWPWVLTEDLLDAQSACHDDPRAIVRAKVKIERAVAGDVPALKALGVPTIGPVELVERASERAAIDRPLDAEARAAATALANLPAVLCHGELVCANARLAGRGVVIIEWRRAHIGCGLLDVAQLATDVSGFSGKAPGVDLFGFYGELAGVSVTAELIRAAQLVHASLRRSR
ncbi:MAG TPA: phosphotransferase [Candidatus Limnocylindria bacterium]|jgi:hypothetical protein|nr:phosphotransferase [Candidatus Limnocylindria bacterium]